MDFREAAARQDEKPRVYQLDTLEFRADDEGPLRFSGHAAVFNSITNLGFFQEMVAPGAFTKTLSENPDVRLLVDHEPSTVMARTASGTLTLDQDDRGLKSSSDLDPEDFDVQRVRTKMKRGDVNQMSFGFRVIRQEWDEAQDPPLRILKEVSLHDGDVSIVTYPAYTATDAQMRDIAGMLQTLASMDGDLERFAETFAELRDGRNLKPDSRQLVEGAHKALTQLLRSTEEGKRYTPEMANRRLRMLELELQM